MSNFYLMTRAAYAKLSAPVARVALRAGLTPDAITIDGTAGTVLGEHTDEVLAGLGLGPQAIATLRAEGACA